MLALFIARSSSRIKKPSPLLPAIISAVVTRIKAIDKPMRSPVTIYGDAPGRMICRRICQLLRPKVRPVSIKVGSTRRTPSMVLMRIGQTLAYTVTLTIMPSPMPSKSIATGMIATDGMGRSNSIDVVSRPCRKRK